METKNKLKSRAKLSLSSQRLNSHSPRYGAGVNILAIETSCDETAIALVKAWGGLKHPRFRILKNLVASQIKIHAPFGGVVPNLAKREHLKNLPVLLEKIQDSRSKIKDFDIVAVTVGPGLEPALWTGINFAQAIYQEVSAKSGGQRAKLIGVSHLDGHLYSILLEDQSYKLKADEIFPAIALIVSGGHTTLVKMDSVSKYKKIGETVDDAAGEAFDKVARLLGLPYPGGPAIEKLAKEGNPDAINFPRPMLNQKNYNFSFSGLKTSVLYYLRDLELRIEIKDHDKIKADVAASFQKAVFDVLIKKTLRAAGEFKAKSIMISGGVASNKTLRKEFKKNLRGADYQLHVTRFPTDNAAMIAAAAYINHLRNKKYKLIAQGNLSL